MVIYYVEFNQIMLTVASILILNQAWAICSPLENTWFLERFLLSAVYVCVCLYMYSIEATSDYTHIK